MSFIRVNDIFDELFAENKRLLNELLFSNKCLNVLIEIKYNFNSIIDELKTNLNENQLKTIEDLEKRYQTIESEKQLFFGNKCENNCKTSNQCFESQNIGSNNKRKTRSNSLKEKPNTNENIKQLIVMNKIKNKIFIKEEINGKNSLIETNDNSMESELTDDISEDESNSMNSWTQNDNQLSDDSMTDQNLKKCPTSNQKSNKCPVIGCQESIDSKGLNRHLIINHRNLKEYKCCEKTFHESNESLYDQNCL